MIREGSRVPAVSLPGYVDGERERVDLGNYLGEGIVVVAFYPADFNPACTMRDSDLGDLDLFTMQKDVSVFAVSPDSTYSHEAFAERYDLHVPLLSDGDGEAADAFDVAAETDLGESVVERAVFVVDHHGVIQYAWASDDLEAEFDVAPVKEAVGDIGGDDTALERYLAGLDSYVAAREAFVEAMAAYEDSEWMVARNGFERAEPAFATAADHFDTAVRFAETAAFETAVDLAEEKADTLRHATDWLADSADAIASGRGKQGQQYRRDAQRLLDAAADLPEPPAEDCFELTDDGIELADAVAPDPDGSDGGDDGHDWRLDDEESVDAELDVDAAALDAAVADDAGGASGKGSVADEGSAADGHDGSSIEGDTVEGDLEMDLDAIEDADADADDASSDGDGETADEAPDPTAGGPPAADSPDEASPPTDSPTSTDRSASPEAVEGPSNAGESAGSSADPSAPLMRGGSSAPDHFGEPSDGGSEGSGADADEEEVEELDLADPTEGDDGDDDEAEQRDWDIPGQ